MRKSLYDISWQVSEEQYRKDKALSYSTLARYEREGFSKLHSLFDKLETPSLTLGSAVDTLITDGREAFDERFFVAEFPSVPDSIITIVKDLFKNFSNSYNNLAKIPTEAIIEWAGDYNYQPNWRPETRAKVIVEKGSSYYNLLYVAGNKTILDTATYNDVMNMVSALKDSHATEKYFAEDNPFDNIERHYQLKFKSTFQGIDYRCMSDLLIVLHDDKKVIPCDLKTTGKPEYLFYKSFVDFRYDIQSRLYWRIIRDNMDKDDYYKNFELTDYKFIVVNKKNLDPMIWDFPVTRAVGTLKFKDGLIMRDPEEIGKELSYYLNNNPKRPIGIMNENNLCEWLNNEY